MALAVAGMLLCLLVLSQPLGESESVVVVATEANTELFARMQSIRDWNAAVSGTVVDVAEWQRRLTGLASPKVTAIADAEAFLDNAADCEARFDRDCARRLREDVLRAYENNPLPSRELLILAARALHDTAAAELAEGRLAEALQLARTAMRRFPNVPLDSQRHPPRVTELFVRATADLRRAPMTTVSFRTNKPGRLFIDGAHDEAVTESVSRKLQQGSYRVWIADAGVTSLVHELTVASTTTTVDVDFALESALSWSPVPQLRCTGDCPQRLRELAQRVRVDKALGLSLSIAHAPAIGSSVRARDGLVETAPVVALSAMAARSAVSTHAVSEPAPGPDRFSAWSLMPFGVGQLAQKRYLAGGIYAGVQGGLLAWHLAAASRARSYDGPNPEVDESRRGQRNLSGALFIGALVASVVEAVIVGAVTP